MTNTIPGTWASLFSVAHFMSEARSRSPSWIPSHWCKSFKKYFTKSSKLSNLSTLSQEVLSLDTINPQVKQAEYAVRGLLAIEADRLAQVPNWIWWIKM